MNPLNNFIVCKADLDQKKKKKIQGTDIELFISTEYNENLRERNPNYCTVVYPGNLGRTVRNYNPYKEYEVELEPGDEICVQHFQLVDHSGNSNSIMEENGEPLFMIDYNEVFFKIKNGEIIPLSNFLVCERLPDIYVNELEVEQERYTESRAIVTHVSKYIKGIKVGDKIRYEKYADYEFEYHGKKYIRMRDDEILGKYE